MTLPLDYRDIYRSWKIPDTVWAGHDVTSAADLTTLLERLESELPQRNVRVVPSHFDGRHPDLRALPLPHDYSWRSCEEALRHFDSQFVMLRLPGFLQASSLVYASCAAVGAPLYPNEPDNLPLGLAAITAGSIDTIITTALDAGSACRLGIRGQHRPPGVESPQSSTANVQGSRVSSADLG